VRRSRPRSPRTTHQPVPKEKTELPIWSSDRSARWVIRILRHPLWIQTLPGMALTMRRNSPISLKMQQTSFPTRHFVSNLLMRSTKVSVAMWRFMWTPIWIRKETSRATNWSTHWQLLRCMKLRTHWVRWIQACSWEETQMGTHS